MKTCVRYAFGPDDEHWVLMEDAPALLKLKPRCFETVG